MHNAQAKPLAHDELEITPLGDAATVGNRFVQSHSRRSREPRNLGLAVESGSPPARGRRVGKERPVSYLTFVKMGNLAYLRIRHALYAR